MFVLALIAAVQVAPEVGKTMASDDWHHASPLFRRLMFAR